MMFQEVRIQIEAQLRLCNRVCKVARGLGGGGSPPLIFETAIACKKQRVVGGAGFPYHVRRSAYIQTHMHTGLRTMLHFTAVSRKI